ncbi:Predicted archaeal kinase [Chromobacterium violaceum]|uniref:Predicted archaeal kinase n=1 Tax=Chromobacterium violaceum TaxID=536 RepID=A0A447TK45_CHRVL|nr:Predicted archaeal kinase [Chromobacterium violaceum]
MVKLGGSLITCEGPGGPDVDRDLLTARARELAACGRPLVLVHGTGAYGKPPARRYGYLDGRLPSGRAGVVAEVARDLARLELEVVDCLEAGGLKPLRLPPSSCSAPARVARLRSILSPCGSCWPAA